MCGQVTTNPHRKSYLSNILYRRIIMRTISYTESRARYAEGLDAVENVEAGRRVTRELIEAE